MITANDKIRAARMFAIDEVISLFNQYKITGIPVDLINGLMLDYAGGRCDYFDTVQRAVRVLNSAEAGAFHNSVSALEYLRGYFSPITAANYRSPRDRNSSFYWSRIAAAWRAGYFASHRSY